MSLENKIQEYANFVDKFDRISGPACYLLYITGSEKLKTVATTLALTELLLVKAPFVLTYIKNTKDYSSLLYWIPFELVSNYAPIVELMDIFPFYKWRVENFYKNN
jgi:hypothetical protein